VNGELLDENVPAGALALMNCSLGHVRCFMAVDLAR
jgi:hypothetical protein